MTSMLETAADPQRLKRVAIDPLSRVEGHGKVTLLLDDQNRVHQARLHIVEFRGFEKFIQGRPYWEVPVLVQRLCGICPVSHHLAASKAMDVLVGAVRPTPTAEKIRRLMHLGQILQSHALHFFHLASPDLLFGFDSEAARRNVVALAAAHPETARKGVLLRKYGQEVIRLTAGKRIHGTGSIPGGMNKNLDREERDYLLRDIEQVVAWTREAVELIKRIYSGRPGFYNGFGFFRSRGRERGWYRVGPLARINNCDFIPTPLAEAERREFKDFDRGSATQAGLAYHWARMIEMLQAAEAIRDLLGDPDLLGGDLVTKGLRSLRGVGVIEAPRGTLIHHYRVDENDLIVRANLIVSTTHNNEAMNEAVRQVVLQYLDGREVTEPLLNHIEVAIRAYDPCLSCATHALGRMPLLACGNASRGDDALRLLLLARAAELTAAHPEWGEFRCIEDFQFQVEHALELAGRDLVLFIDAAVADPAPWRFSPVAPRADASFTSHALSPAAVLEVYRRAVGPNPPPCYLLCVRGGGLRTGSRSVRGGARQRRGGVSTALPPVRRRPARRVGAGGTRGAGGGLLSPSLLGPRRRLTMAHRSRANGSWALSENCW